MMNRFLAVALAMSLTTPALAESRLPFLKDMVGDRELPKPWGISFDFYTMDQIYALDSLTFQIPGISLDDPSLIDADNSVQHIDIKADVWLFPFLNVFGIFGKIDADTTVDITRTGLPLPLTKFPVDYDGEVYGGGITLAAGGDKWFTTLTATITDTEISGGFNSQVDSLTLQPRIGIVKDDWQFWVGGLYLDTEEKHSGNIEIPFLGQVPFAVELSEQEQFNYAIGLRHQLSEHIDFSFEIGFGDRDHTLFNIGYRF